MSYAKYVIPAVIIVLLGMYGCGAIDYRSDCVRAETTLKAQMEQNKNNYDNFWKAVSEEAQIPSQYVKDFQKITEAQTQGRYGADGSKAVFQFIKEHNPQLDSSLYSRIQTKIEGGRIRFEADQKQLLDMKARYEYLLNSTRGLMYGPVVKYPTLDLNNIQIVTSDVTEAAFKTHKADAIKVF